MLRRLLASLFSGCIHSRTTFPLTPRRRASNTARFTPSSPYVVCLDCGREFDYDWRTMRRGAERGRSPDTADPVSGDVTDPRDIDVLRAISYLDWERRR